ncbi:MAG TPA: diguanylate cyclase [Anaerolineales bacterium]|nr:diguanylate cyclase [Anaerolineales bacterium]
MFIVRQILDITDKPTRYFIVITTFVFYVGIFTRYHNEIGMTITSLAIFPVIAGSWYFGVGGGIVMTLMTILADIGSLLAFDRSIAALFSGYGYSIGNLIILFIAILVGRMATLLREHNASIQRLKELEAEQRTYTNLLESLQEITTVVLEARDLNLAIQILLEKVAHLFQADDSYLALWDEVAKKPIPFAAYGVMKDAYPHMDLRESTLTRYLLNQQRPIGISDLNSFPHTNPALLAKFPTRAVLALPLMAEGRKLGLLYVGYHNPRPFDEKEIAYAEMVARQIALVLTKIHLVEEAQKQVKQLTVLHEVAIIATEAETLDELIERVTDIIGQNLFPDNFGVLLLDQAKGVLKPHPSYRFASRERIDMPEVPLGQGVSGLVAKTGEALRLGNIRDFEHYINIDSDIVSELCVPIKIKDQVLGVINTESTKPNAFTADDEVLLGTLAGQLATAIEQLHAEEAERKWLKQLAHSNDLIYSLAHIVTDMEKALNINDILQVMGAQLRQINITCAVSLFDPQHQRFIFTYTSMPSHVLDQFETGLGYPFSAYRFTLDTLKSLVGDNLNHAILVEDPLNELRTIFTQRRAEDDVKILASAGIYSHTVLMRLPLLFEEKMLGILWLWGDGILKSDLPIMSIFAKQVSSSLERARLFEEVQSLALTDPLTGLHNRRNLFELGKIEFYRARRLNRPFSCMMLDLDHFKQINDTYGHQVGDEVLQEFAKRCKQSVREVDIVGHYGGEEILILLPETTMTTTQQVAERLRRNITEKPFDVAGHKLYITVSIGIASLDEHTLELDTLIARADQAMYIAKHKGRDRVAISV